jgi:hypothetical protein
MRQARLAWDTGVANTLLSRWEQGYYRLRPEQVAAISAHLSRRLQEIKAMELPRQEETTEVSG